MPSREDHENYNGALPLIDNGDLEVWLDIHPALPLSREDLGEEICVRNTSTQRAYTA